MIFQTLKAKIKGILPSRFTEHGEFDGKAIADPCPSLEGFKKQIRIHHGTDWEGDKQTIVCSMTHEPTGVALLINDTVFNLMPDHKREQAFKLLQQKVMAYKGLKRKQAALRGE